MNQAAKTLSRQGSDLLIIENQSAGTNNYQILGINF